MDNLWRVLIGLPPIPRRNSWTDKAIADEVEGTGLLEGYRPEPPERRQATLDEYSSE